MVTTQIDRVTVFRNGALVVRAGTATQGPCEVDGLPLLFASDSLRVRVPKGQVRDVEETCHLASHPAPPARDESALLALALQLQRVDDELATVDALLSAVGDLLPSLPGTDEPAKLPDVGLWLDLLRYSGEEQKSLYLRRDALGAERRHLEEQRQLLQRTTLGDTDPPRFTRGVRFQVEGELPCPFVVEYFVEAARWVPTYALHLDAGRARLVMGALVAQAAGEDWRGVALGFSTVDLSRETTLPELASWRMGRAQPAPRKGFRPLPSDLPGLFAGYDKGATPQAPRPKPEPPPPRPGSDTITGEARAFDKEDQKVARPALGQKKESARNRRSERAAVAKSATVEHDDDDAEAGAEGFALEDGSAYQSMPEEAPSDAPSRPMAASPSASMMFSKDLAAPAPRRAGGPGGFGGGGAAPGPAMVRARRDLPPRLRYAYLRLLGPAERPRGGLVPLLATERLRWLLQDHDDVSSAELERAVRALTEARDRLRQSPIPPGTTALDATHFHHVYEAAGRHDVPGDAAFHRVEVLRHEAPFQVELRCVPRHADDVFRICQAKAPPGTPLPAGPLAVYEDAAFRVNGHLAGLGGGKALELNLGVEPRVRMVGRTVHVNQEEKGLMTQSSRIEHKVRLQVRSTMPEPVRVIVFDRLPMPDDNVKDVEVTLAQSTPPAERTDRDPAGKELVGGLRFQVAVAPGATEVVEYRYTIQIPAKAELEGGNRRE